MYIDGRNNLELRADMDTLYARMSGDTRDLLERIATFDEHDLWRADGARDMAEWVSGRFDVSRWKALRWVKAAHALRSLPLTSEALASGSLCLDKTVELTRFATPETERELISWAKRVMVSTVRAEADAKAAEDRPSAEATERSSDLSWWVDIDQTSACLSGRLPVADGEFVFGVLDEPRVARSLRP